MKLLSVFACINIHLCICKEILAMLDFTSFGYTIPFLQWMWSAQADTEKVNIICVLTL